MKKNGHHHKKKKGRRNDAAGGVALASRPRPRVPRLPKRAPPPPWQTIAAAVAGGGVSAAVGGLVVNQKILSPEAVGVGLMLGGGAAAYFSDGNTRIVGTSMAAAGAGQLALAVMAKQAMKGAGGQQQVANQNQPQPANQNQPQAQLPAPPPAVEPPRKSATGGGVVVDLFRDAASDLDMIEDEWRYGMRDHRDEPRDAAEPLVIDLDEAA